MPIPSKRGDKKSTHFHELYPINWTYHDKTNSKSEKLKEQFLTHGGYSSKVGYEYNKLDQNTKVTDGTFIFRFDYDDQGHVRTYTAGNGCGSTFNYDYTGKVSDLVIGTKSSSQNSGQILFSERYEYDKTGNQTKITHDKEGKTVETNYV
ncbi:hypothetical protein COL21_29095 [Bacillus thuringiensis]|nr:hypothetical protein COL21_29095 [Bacillus thuringiensis]PGR88959.1 hypothetical protein COC68_30935 [Bacillus thuringiensis]